MFRKPASRSHACRSRAASPASSAHRRRTRRGTDSTPRAAAASSCCSGMREEEKITAAQEQRRREPSAFRSSRCRRCRARATATRRNSCGSSSGTSIGGDNPPDWKVHTTFVPEIQDAAEAAVRDGLRRLGVPGLQAALVAIDPRTGNLLAIVGGSDFADDAVQPRRAQPAPAGLGVQAVRLCGGARAAACRRSQPLRGLQQVAVQAPEGVWIPRDERATDAGLDDAARSAARIEQRRGRPAAAAGRRATGAQAGQRPGRARTARRAVARAWQRPGHAARSHRRIRRVPRPGLPRAPAWRWSSVEERRRRSTCDRVAHRARADAFRAGGVSDGDDAAGRRRARHAAQPSAPGLPMDRSAARRARRTITATRGSSASTRRSSSACGSASTSHRRFAGCVRARAWRCQSGRTSCDGRRSRLGTQPFDAAASACALR